MLLKKKSLIICVTLFTRRRAKEKSRKLAVDGENEAKKSITMEHKLSLVRRKSPQLNFYWVSVFFLASHFTEKKNDWRNVFHLFPPFLLFSFKRLNEIKILIRRLVMSLLSCNVNILFFLPFRPSTFA